MELVSGILGENDYKHFIEIIESIRIIITLKEIDCLQLACG